MNDETLNIAVILPAAGASSRFGKGSKIEADVAGKPAFLRSIEAFVGRKQVGKIILAVAPDAVEPFRFRWQERIGFHGVKLIPGGKKDRWETVMLALKEVDDSFTHVAIHDAARPLVSKKLIDRVFTAAERFDAVIPAMPCNATLKMVSEAKDAPADPLAGILGDAAGPTAQQVVRTVDRKDVVEVQTPQVFKRELIERAYAAYDFTSGGGGVTDDASLVEALGEPVYVVEGECTNLKITRQGDLDMASAFAFRRDKAGAKADAERKLFGGN
ncbi:MAG: 2-C-methyl-D-erythritol 4-phosphate cytidylyltransferase [Phycisphaeraceae bacterium]|nr:2-C-methyl-D-erythritol 4-phosphate cytidylyltransferase [Phycisphaeraceae bacterium]